MLSEKFNTNKANSRTTNLFDLSELTRREYIRGLLFAIMTSRPTTSTWAPDSSDDDDENDTSRLLNNGRNPSYQTMKQEDYIREHEQGLDKLGEAIKRQKNMANELNTEVELHNEIIDGIDTGLTSTSDNLRKNTRNIRLISTKSSTFFLWLVIVALAGVIVVLAIW